MKLRTLFDKKHLVVTVSVIIILVTALIAGADVIISGIAVRRANAGFKEATVSIEDIKPGTLNTLATDEAIDITATSRGGGGGSASQPENTTTDATDDVEVYVKVGEISVGAGGLISVGTVNR